MINLPNLFYYFNDCIKGLLWKENVAKAFCFDDLFVNSVYNLYKDNKGECVLDPLNHTVINERGKERLICSNTLKDRLISKTFNQSFLLPTFGPRLIYDNCASLKGKGVDFALNRLEYMLHRAYINYGNNFYILKLDVRHYFDSIYHPYIMSLISKFTTDYRILSYFNNCFIQFQNDPFIHEGMPIPQGIGLGSECDQTFGLICLDEMDHIIKEQFRIKGYVRYMDDAVLISESKEQLIEIYKYLQQYLASQLYMEFNKDKSNITHISEGIMFLKIHFYVTPIGAIYRKVYKPTIRRMVRKMKSFAEMLKDGEIAYTDINASYYSSMGTLLRADCKDQIKKVNALYNELFIEDWINHKLDDFLIA